MLATLIRLLGDFDRAEEAVHDAFVAAAAQWPQHGVPANPFAWLVSAGRFKAIDRLRQKARFDGSVAELTMRLEADAEDPEMLLDEKTIEDDQLRLIFICCHPVLPADAQVALTLREVCGLTTEDIAHAFLTAAPTIAQRIVRAKAKIRDAGIPYEAPARNELAGRLDYVLQRHLSRLQRRLFGSVRRLADAARPVRRKRSGSAACWSRCCPIPKRPVCWR